MPSSPKGASIAKLAGSAASFFAKRARLAARIILPLAIASPIVAKALIANIPQMAGCDSITHAYKVSVLIEQMKSMNALHWGLYDWTWYSGYPI